jgi:hypothetical protein
MRQSQTGFTAVLRRQRVTVKTQMKNSPLDLDHLSNHLLRVRIIEGYRERELVLYRSLRPHAGSLRSEMGEAAEPLYEAESGIAREHAAPRVQKVFMVAKKL